MRVTTLIAMLVLAACQRADVPAGQPAESGRAVEMPADTSAAQASAALTSEGWGPLRIGMSRTEVVAALGEDANPNAVGGPDSEQCDEFRPDRAPDGMIVMIENGFLSRITLIRDATVRTPRGFAVGDSAAAIRQAYGADATVTPHKYQSAPAEYFTVRDAGSSGAAARGIAYEVGAEGRVTHIHAGGPSIEYVEGCL